MSPDSWVSYYTQSVVDFITANVSSKRVADKIFEYRKLLESVPDLGRPYDPDYPAARTPFPCRVVIIPDTPFSLYYIKESESKRIIIFCIEYQRIDPNARFSHIEWGIGSF